MNKIITKIILCVIVAVLLNSTEANCNEVSYENFPLGCYTYLCNNNSQEPYTDVDRDSILATISSLGYNNVLIDNKASDSNLSGLLSKLYNNNLKAIVNDLYYTYNGSTPTDNNNFSISALTTSSYMKFEAEYNGINDPSQTGDDMEDVFWYCSHAEHNGAMPRIGSVYNDGGNKVWKSTQDDDNIGYAYTDIRWRWFNTHPLINSYKRFGDEFQIYDEHDPASYDANKFLYIRYKIKLNNFAPSVQASTPLLRLTTMGYRGAGTADSTNIAHQFTNYNSSLLNSHTTDFCYGDYLQASSPDGYFEVEIKISYADLIVQNLLNRKDWFRYSLVNLNPRVLWLGNCDLYLDYIEIEDQMHYNMMHNSAIYNEGINERINFLQSRFTSDPQIIKYMYGRCEPTQSQFDSYKTIQEHINYPLIFDPNPNPNVITAAYDTHYRNVTISQDRYYDHVNSFKQSAAPEIILPDMYPIRPGIIYNSALLSDGNTLQTTLSDKVLRQYKNCKKDAINPLSTTKEFIPIVQTFGDWNGSQWMSWTLPPLETQLCLKYLPLCYGPDGIIDYRAVESLNGPIASNPAGQYCIIMKDTGGLILTSNFTRDAIKAANMKIAVLGPMVKDSLTWVDAGCLHVGNEPSDLFPGTSLSGMGVSSIQVRDTANSVYYNGFIQCGFYKDKHDSNIPYFMMVNRRTNYSTSDLVSTFAPPSEYNSGIYFAATPQNGCIIPNAIAHDRFGTHISLYDVYDKSIHNQNNESEILVEIGPGDGKLLQMCSSLPPNVTSNADVKSIAYLSGNITIDNSAEVTIHPGTTTNIFANSTIRVKGGSTLNISGTVDIFENVSIIVEEGSSISFNNAICKWGASSILHVENSELSATNTTLENFTNGVRWGGLRVSDSSQVILNNSHFTNAQFNSIQNSDCLITDCNFSIPSTSCGLLVANTEPGHQTDIINTLPGRGFHGSSNIANQGISFGTMRNDVNLSNIEFQNLWHGITKSAQPYASDTIVDCEFSNCQVGIWLFNNSYSSQIENCNFSSQSGTYGTGISLEASSPKITNCNFDNLQRGIISQYAIHSGLGMQSVISESTFQNCELGIESRSSNHHLVGNYFYYNNRAIVNHAGSNLNLSYYANNVLKSWNTNIQFFDTMPYESTIQLFKGHNDLYHLIGSYDFSFDENYYSMPLTLNHQINASKNWFETGQYSVNNPSYLDYVFVDLYDSSPSMPAPPDLTDRLCKALSYEDNQMYELAGALYKIIIDEKLEEEKSYITCAIDGLYRCTQLIADPAWELAEYFDQKAIQCAIDDPHLSALLKDYLAKVFVIEKDFQAAIDLIQLRIDNPISEIDSLRAVLDLEIVLQIASMQEAKSPINTKYSQYQYPDSIVYKEMHDKNWEKYIKAMNHDDPENVMVIPPQPQIQSNYPNPFNPSTTVAFSVPEYGSVKLSIYNLRGQKVKDLINTDMQKGFHKAVWDGTDAKHNCVSSGLYLLRLETAKGISSRKVMLLK